MKIAFNLLNARAGAGISVYQMLLPAISNIDYRNDYYVFLDRRQKEIIETIPESFNKIIFKKIPHNSYLRVLWEQLVLPFYIKKLGIDILYTGGNTTVVLARCKKLLFIENTNPFSKVIKRWTFKERLRIKLLYVLGYISSRVAHRIRYCSKRSMDIINNIYKIKGEKTFVLYHGLDFDKIDLVGYKSNLNYKYILSVGIIAPHKNYEVLIKAFGYLRNNSIYDGKLLIIGDKDYYPDYTNRLKDLCKDEGVENYVYLLGKVSYNEIFNFYKNADIFVFPSVEETFGIPLIEAMYFNLPVVASDGNEYKEYFIPFNEIADNKVIYFDPFSYMDLAGKIQNLLKNKGNVEKNNSREYVKEKYSMNKVACELVKQFNNIGR